RTGSRPTPVRVSSALVRLWASIPPTVCPNHHIVQGGWETPLTLHPYKRSAITATAHTRLV
ncbi:hypothetical protein, partial [Sphingobium sp. LMC3-1-1.1]|uniref:hypothetical protein n=1 Tax=Sphingobium sp. LMC3-1-1.1 TaxID=3135241 RepID=UPI003420ADE0